jgi:hypothetical protein
MDQSGARNAFCRAVKAEGLFTTAAVLNESQTVKSTPARQLKSTQASPHTRTRRATAYAICPRNRHPLSKMRTFIDFASEAQEAPRPA